MKKYMNKTVLSLLTVAAVAGGALTPMMVNAGASTTTEEKIVLPGDVQENYRYSLKTLETENKLFLEMLLDKYADDLYVVIDHEDFKLDKPLEDVLTTYGANWKETLEAYYNNTYLVVRFDDSEGFLNYYSAQEDGVTYVRGSVDEDVTKVRLILPNGTKVDVLQFTDGKFSVSIPEVTGTNQKVKLEAYVDGQTSPIETVEVTLDDVVETDQNVVVNTFGFYNPSKSEVRVQGIAKKSVDKLVVVYGTVRQEVKLQDLWSEVGSFSTTFKLAEKPTVKKATIEAYVDGVKVETEEVEIENISAVTPPPATPAPTAKYSIKATAQFSAKYKIVNVKGTVAAISQQSNTTATAAGDLKLYIIAPDGKKHEISVADGAFEVNLTFQNRSFSAKNVRLELYSGTTLVGQADVAYGIPNNKMTPPAVTPAASGTIKVEVKGGKVEVKSDDDHDEDEDDNDDNKKQGNGKGNGNGNGKGKDKK
ncbi:hypothetical protein [Brevibacillus dissolubilis]|uniref:hypothetical protein n=1 Tax=Brevibacillus dissolubilis TaxID=1844116 RepID=UPI001117A2DD|nr:hypothetical protein [Brevibacillus dissolubilis]